MAGKHRKILDGNSKANTKKGTKKKLELKFVMKKKKRFYVDRNVNIAVQLS